MPSSERPVHDPGHPNAPQEYDLIPYLWFVQIDGNQTLDGVGALLDMDFGDGTSAAMGMSTTSKVKQLLLEADVTYLISKDLPIEILGGLH